MYIGGYASPSPEDIFNEEDNMLQVLIAGDESYILGEVKSAAGIRLSFDVAGEYYLTARGVENTNDALIISPFLVVTVMEDDASVDTTVRYTDTLISKIAEAEGYTQSSYTAASWSVLSAALANARRVRDNEGATQAEIDAAVQTITEAVNALRLSDSGGGGRAGNTGGNGTMKKDIDDDQTPLAQFTERTEPFDDVKETDWFYEAVNYVFENGLMNGTAALMFSPDTNLSRAMIVTILWRLEDEPVISGKNAFNDVSTGQWYSDAIEWANANGIVEGYGNEAFGPNDDITREQLAAILCRYAAWKELDTSKTTDLSVFTDAWQISVFAQDAMKWANAEGFITGRTATTLVPAGTATRAETAVILMRFMENNKV
jgi:hypothetical protein